jgi:hypothetical protein
MASKQCLNPATGAWVVPLSLMETFKGGLAPYELNFAFRSSSQFGEVDSRNLVNETAIVKHDPEDAGVALAELRLSSRHKSGQPRPPRGVVLANRKFK